MNHQYKQKLYKRESNFLTISLSLRLTRGTKIHDKKVEQYVPAWIFETTQDTSKDSCEISYALVWILRRLCESKLWSGNFDVEISCQFLFVEDAYQYGLVGLRLSFSREALLHVFGKDLLK